jgi:hypothetical protein
MPYVWVEPEKFMSAEETEDVAVHHCYKQHCVMEHHYQIASDKSGSGWMAFDIRDLKRALRLTHTTHQGIILAALDKYGPPLEEVIDLLIDWYGGETED